MLHQISHQENDCDNDDERRNQFKLVISVRFHGRRKLLSKAARNPRKIKPAIQSHQR